MPPSAESALGDVEDAPDELPPLEPLVAPPLLLVVPVPPLEELSAPNAVAAGVGGGLVAAARGRDPRSQGDARCCDRHFRRSHEDGPTVDAAPRTRREVPFPKPSVAIFPGSSGHIAIVPADAIEPGTGADGGSCDLSGPGGRPYARSSP